MKIVDDSFWKESINDQLQHKWQKGKSTQTIELSSEMLKLSLSAVTGGFQSDSGRDTNLYRRWFAEMIVSMKTTLRHSGDDSAQV